MLPYATAGEAEALGCAMTWAEAAWFRYSAAMPDYCLYCHNVAILLLVYMVAPLPLALPELILRDCHGQLLLLPHKVQPRIQHPVAAFLWCYMATVHVLLLIVSPLQLVSYPVVKAVGIRTGLPLPSTGETAVQLVVYLLVEEYLGYWIHRLLHTRWGYVHSRNAIPATANVLAIPFCQSSTPDTHPGYHIGLGGSQQLVEKMISRRVSSLLHH